MVREQSYGIVPLCMQEGIWHLLLIQHGSAGYWGFPKGHAEPEESPKEAAIRELKEETNLKVVRFLSESVLEEHYQFFFRGHRIDKTVWYFVAEVKGKIKLQQEEVGASKWVPLTEAVHHITYETDKSICRNAIALCKNTGLL